MTMTNKTKNRQSIAPCGVFGLSEGSLSHKAGEDVNDFMDRMVAELPEVLVKAEGSLEIAAAVFGSDVAVVKDLVKAYSVLDEARAQGLIIAVSRNKGEDDAANEAQARALNHVRNVDNRIRIDKWSGNSNQRHDKLMQLLPRAISDYGGREHAIAAALSLTADEVLAAIESDEELVTLKAIAYSALIGRVEDHLIEIALTSQSPTAPIFVLKNMIPEKYSDKQEVTLSGFAKPPVIAELPSVLSVVNGGKKEN